MKTRYTSFDGGYYDTEIECIEADVRTILGKTALIELELIHVKELTEKLKDELLEFKDTHN